jgi:UDP-2,4-diacetamido-2,4,6-trideoxy-beta-L-altropyranose hydrolase
MRCLTLAEALRARGCECLFLCRNHPGNLNEAIRQRGYSVHELPTSDPAEFAIDSPDPGPAHAAWLGTDWRTDALQTAAAVGEAGTDWLVVDHYALDARWESALRPLCRRIMVIDDLADREHECDLLLDHNLLPALERRYDGLLPASARKLLGPRYALLRSEFSREVVEVTDDEVGDLPRLLVMFGGADQDRQTERVLRVLAGMGWSGPVDVVAGPLYPDLDTLREVVSALPAATLHVSARDMARLMRGADLALGAPGVSSLERCACALPSMTVALARNQEGIGIALAEVGAHWYLGRAAEVVDSDWQDALRVLGQNKPIRKAMRTAAAAVCDGQGVRRVVSHLVYGEMAVRQARSEDGPLLFAWRNDERVRRRSFDPRPFDSVAHQNWLAKTLVDPDVDLLLVGLDGLDLACIRFDCAGETGTVSIYIDPGLQGQGIGLPALLAAIDWLRDRRPGLRQLEAVVLASNHASHRLFSTAGFVPTKTNYALDLRSGAAQGNFFVGQRFS